MSKGDESWYPGDIEERFECVLLCDNRYCNEPIMVCGRTGHEQVWDQEEGQTWDRYFMPVFFYPAPPIIRIPKECPEDIRHQLKEAFSMYWFHLGGSANRLRNGIELILTYLKVQRFARSTKRGRVRLALHNRILIFREKHREFGDLMLAVKWLGNEGSHPGKMTKDDVLDGFEIIEHLLREVFEQTSSRIASLSRQIIRAKGPRSKVTKRPRKLKLSRSKETKPSGST